MQRQRTRLARMQRSPWSWHNDVVRAHALTVVLFGTLIATFGPAMIPFPMIQAVVGFSELEVVREARRLSRRGPPPQAA